MDERYAEPLFDVLVVFATGIAIAAYMLGVLLDPLPAVVVAGGLVVLGAAVLVPDRGRVLAGLVGAVAVVLGGVVVPRAVVSVVEAGDEMALTLVASAVVLVVAFAVLRVTAFGRRARPS
jgi:hypothetical protein